MKLATPQPSVVEALKLSFTAAPAEVVTSPVTLSSAAAMTSALHLAGSDRNHTASSLARSWNHATTEAGATQPVVALATGVPTALPG